MLINFLKQLVVAKIKNLYSLNMPEQSIIVEIPKEAKHGDYSTNVAMQLAKQLRKRPLDIANELSNAIRDEAITKIEVINPGFINLFLDNSAFNGIIETILMQKEKYGELNKKTEKVNVEFISANPTGTLHLGHARGAAIGDSLVRIMKKAGYDTVSEYYINDAGNQINNLGKSLQVRYLQNLGINAEIPEDGYFASDIIEIAATIKAELGDSLAKDISSNLEKFKELGIAKLLERIKEDLKFYRVHFDVYSSEKKFYEQGLVDAVIPMLEERGEVYEHEGAKWLKSTSYGDDKDRVLQKSDGSLTYLTPDIAYHKNKFERGFTKLIDVLGADHHSYINRLKASVSALGYNANNLDILIVQMVRLIKNGEEYKMSKRTGNAITLRELCEEVGVDTVRYFFVSKSSDSHMDFDIDLALKKSNENPFYYIQYAYARICSIESNVNESNLYKINKINTKLLTNPKEKALIKLLDLFPFIIDDSANSKQVYKIALFAYNLAQAFHSFYSDCRVLDANYVELSNQRLALVVATKIVMFEALNLLGIVPASKM